MCFALINEWPLGYTHYSISLFFKQPIHKCFSLLLIFFLQVKIKGEIKHVTRINLTKLLYLFKLKASFKSRTDFTCTFLKQDTLKPKNFGGNIFGRFLQISAENFSYKFYNVGTTFWTKKCDRFGKRAVFKG